MTFYDVCVAGDLIGAQRWYTKVYNKSPYDLYDEDDPLTPVYIESIFFDVCARGHLRVAEWLNSKFTIPITVCQMEKACYGGHLDMAKWIYRVGDIDNNSDTILANTCFHGHLDVAKWLHSIRTKPPVVYMTILNDACRREHIHIIKWVISLRKFDLMPAFGRACCNGQLTVAKLLLRPTYNLDWTFVDACVYGHINIANWIYSIMPDINIPAIVRLLGQPQYKPHNKAIRGFLARTIMPTSPYTDAYNFI